MRLDEPQSRPYTSRKFSGIWPGVEPGNSWMTVRHVNHYTKYVVPYLYEEHPESKERFAIPRYSLLIIVQKLNILFHIVTFDIKALVPWHSLCIPSSYHGAAYSILQSSSFAKRILARCSFIFGNRKKSDGARSGLYGGCSKMSQWNCSSSETCVCRAVCGRALSCNRTIPRESLPLRKDNLRSHRPVENE